MPHIQIIDHFGGNHMITSSDPEVIKGWLLEHASMLSSTNASLGPVQLFIRPMPGIHDGEWDWPPDFVPDLNVTRGQLQALADFIRDGMKSDG